MIGTVGNSGTEAYHLHYTQLQDGKAVRIAFNGSLINTGQTNQASWGTWGNGEALTSLNCPQNSLHLRLPGRPADADSPTSRAPARSPCSR